MSKEIRISHSKVELYQLCGAKYRYQYIEKLTDDRTYTPLLFGSALDKALNYVLTRTKRKHTVYADTAKAILIKNMNKWRGENELVFFKSEMPKELYIDDDHDGNQARCHEYLCSVGVMMIDTYIKDILPNFSEIVSVQTKKLVKNLEGDTLVLITDFVARLQDGRIAVLDNKSTSDIKKNYGKSSVAKSQQLAIYAEYEQTRTAGYVALSKKLKDGKVDWTLVVDEIPEEMSEKAFDKIDEALRGIKEEKFEKNTSACFSYGRLCPYASYCRYGSKKGLIESKRK